MKRIMKKLLLLSLPFLLAFSFFFAFEPYDWLGLKGEHWYMTGAISSKRELLLKQPENLIFGDSHIANLNTGYIASVGGGDWTMMAYGGATLGESIADFWWAAEHTEMKNVVFGLSFYSMNDNHFAARHETAVNNAESIFTFVADYAHWHEAWQNLQVKVMDIAADFTGNEALRIFTDNPSSLTQDTRPATVYGEDGRREDLVAYSQHIVAATQGGYSCFGYCEQLGEIIDYCDANGINITFVLFPSHDIIWQEVIAPLSIGNHILYYKDFLKSRATVLDMELQNELSATDGVFLDGFHVVLEQKKEFARVIFAGEQADYCVRTTPESYAADRS